MNMMRDDIEWKERQRRCKQFRKGNMVLIVSGPDAEGDIVQCRAMRGMANSGKMFRIEDITDDNVFLKINGWWFEPMYIRHPAGIKNPTPIKVKPTFFDESHLVI